MGDRSKKGKNVSYIIILLYTLVFQIHTIFFFIYIFFLPPQKCLQKKEGRAEKKAQTLNTCLLLNHLHVLFSYFKGGKGDDFDSFLIYSSYI